ncbi:hypothetical protein [Streptomyces sp. NPDC094468]|uniref:hypothetical protein n=1 Tax=Streptomyces sp. NPDC094468 TaxID=3366066 RepID=UPI00381050B7
MDDLLFLAYTFQTTPHANAHPGDFWAWMADRNDWFYEGLTMVLDTRWRIEHQGNGQLIHHEVLFADESGLASYREALRIRSRDEAWEQRRTSQDRWYRIVARSVQTSPPVPMTVGRHLAGRGSPGRAERPAVQQGATAGEHAVAVTDEDRGGEEPVPWFLQNPTARTHDGPVPWHSVAVPEPVAEATASARPAPSVPRPGWRPLLAVVVAAVLVGCSLTAWAIRSLP